MTERPILMSAPMVRALLAGTKLQTRRVCKLEVRAGMPEPEWQSLLKLCPYGQPGDRLWVRESHWWFKDEPDHETGYYPPPLGIDDVEYRADGDDGRKVWRPSIHMPRWASRITLEVTGVRVERLQDISESDARAEGITDGGCLNCGNPEPCGCAEPAPDARDSYCNLWGQINGPDSWSANPWVWVVEFKRVKP